MTETENATEADPNLGQVLADSYRIDALLDRGGMGNVYSGVQLSVNRPVAVKMIAHKVEHSAEHVARFRREAEAMAKLEHPNTVRLFDFGVTDQGQMFMVMQLLSGCDLGNYLARTPAHALGLSPTLGIIRQIAQALSEAHAHGIVHRDLKPGNVFLSRVEGGDACVKVMDFGIAGIEQEEDRTQLTKSGAIVGTPAYMAPEQAQGLAVDGRANLYALGMMMFEMLAGRSPFDTNSAVSLLIAQVMHAPPPIVEVCPELQEAAQVQALLDRLLAKNPDDRFSSAAALINAIDELLLVLGPSSSTDIPALTESVASRESLPAPHARTPLASHRVPTPSGTTVASTIPRSRNAFRIGFGLGALALIALGLLWSAKPALVAEESTSITIASTPSGALVRSSGAELGKTPYQLHLKRPMNIEVSLPAHAARTMTISPDGEPTVIVQLKALPPYADRAAP